MYLGLPGLGGYWDGEMGREYETREPLLHRESAMRRDQLQSESPHVFYHGVKKLLICGSRTTTVVYKPVISDELDHLDGSIWVCHGGNGYWENGKLVRGLDMLADEVLREKGFKISVYDANWAKFGYMAGPIRNEFMLKDFDPDAILAFRMPGDSPGTDGMLRLGRGAGKPCRIVGL